ncbi:MAG: ABC-type multidrug transport system ATPase subunit [Flavobacteriales bacterium]
MEYVLNLQGLSKVYSNLTAVNNLDFSITKGSVFGLLGPNGSGKTTTLGMILGVIKSSSGNYQWFGEKPKPSVLKRIGAILETPNFYPYLSAFQNLEIVAEIKEVNKNRINEVLKLVGLFDRSHDDFKTYSLGMKQRLAIASALLPNPEVLILDEPTNGLDPQGISEIRELINQVAKQGVTIILASHLLDEVEKVCTDVLVLQRGEKLYQGTVAGLNSEFDQIIVNSDKTEELKATLEAMAEIQKVESIENKLTVTLTTDLTTAELNQRLYSKGIVLSHLERNKKTLEKHFLELIAK